MFIQFLIANWSLLEMIKHLFFLITTLIKNLDQSIPQFLLISNSWHQLFNVSTLWMHNSVQSTKKVLNGILEVWNFNLGNLNTNHIFQFWYWFRSSLINTSFQCAPKTNKVEQGRDCKLANHFKFSSDASSLKLLCQKVPHNSCGLRSRTILLKKSLLLELRDD